MFTIKNHRLFHSGEAIEFKKSPNYTKDFILEPEGILLHDTAGRLDGNTSVAWFLNPAARASAHILVHRNGYVTQLLSLNQKAWHAGQSSLDGRTGVNDFSLGIEIVNPGKLTKVGEEKYQAWYGEIFNASEYGIIEKSTREHGTAGWMSYTTEQLSTVEELCVSLFGKYGLKWLWPHWKVSPGRKVDTNPLFPLEYFQAKITGRSNDDGNFATLLANTNQRRWPSYRDNVIQVIPRSERVEVIRSGWYQNDDEYAQWFLVRHNGHEGWVHGSLVEFSMPGV